VHFHVYLHSNSKFKFKNKDDMTWDGVAPHFISDSGAFCRARSASKAAGMYYLSAPKAGALFSSASISPHFQYIVQPQWIWNMLCGMKMSPLSARKELVAQCRDLPRLLACLDRWMKEKDVERLDVHQESVQTQLLSMRRPFRRLLEVDQWVAAHQDIRWRYPFLVLTGPSSTGKTQFAKSLAPFSAVMEVNMANSSEPDLKTYNHEVHQLILLDECSALAVLTQKKLMQAPPCQIALGTSKTNAFSYSVWVHAKMLVVCSNVWHWELANMSPPDQEWLTTNAVVIDAMEPLYT